MATTKHPKIIIVIVCVIFLFCGAGYYLGAFGTGLASDEEMIAHFKEHRAEIEELVKRYREFDPETAAEPKLVSVKHANGTWEDRYVKDHTLWIEQNDTRALAKKAGVDIHWSGMGIFGDSNFGGNRTIWLPNPYSIESGELFDSMTKDKYNEIFYRRGMLRVQLMPRNKYWKNTFRYAAIRKDLYHIPEIPRVENGELLGPFNKKGEYSFRRAVLPSLNYIPSIWHRKVFSDSNCVLRQIEPQWFLRMCSTGCEGSMLTRIGCLRII